MKKTIRDYDLFEKRVIIRVDFNVPIIDKQITDDNRIVESLKTIEYAIENGAKVILMSHLGRIKEKKDKAKNSLSLVAIRLSELLGKEVIFINNTRGNKLEKAIKNLSAGDVLLMENTRFEDFEDSKESKNDPELGTYWASLGDIYINDAFGTAHRAHASNVGIASNLPNGIGFLIEKELKYLGKAIDTPDRPLTVVMGGAKISDKIPVIENLVKIADHILIGGGMANTFLAARGYEVGNSLLDKDSLDFCKQVLADHFDKIVLPTDVVTGTEFSEDTQIRMCNVDEIEASEMALDIGMSTLDTFVRYLQKSKTIIWNGPVGAFELEKFSLGTRVLCEELSKLDRTVILGGGDTAAAAIQFGYKDSYTHISTGGGASLELLEGKELPGIAVMMENE